MIMHFLHNAIGAMSVVKPEWPRLIGIDDAEQWAHFPVHVIVLGSLVFVLGLAIASRQPIVPAARNAGALLDRQHAS
jgi:hypothetical protein